MGFRDLGTRFRRVQSPEVVAGRDGSLDPRRVELLTWLPEFSGRSTLMESAIRLGSLGQILSLLWIPDLDGDESEEQH